MCLEHCVEGALASGMTWIVVDLRDLTSIDDAALAMFVQAHADCHAAGVHLSLLISDRPGQREIAIAFDAVGLTDDLDIAAEPPPPPARAPRCRAGRRVPRPLDRPYPERA
jgi:anti-anti-sigma regulatory factor